MLSRQAKGVYAALLLTLGAAGCGVSDSDVTAGDKATKSAPSQSNDIVHKQVHDSAAINQTSSFVAEKHKKKIQIKAGKNLGVTYHWRSDLPKWPKLSFNINGVNQTLAPSGSKTRNRKKYKYSPGKHNKTFATDKALDYTFAIYADNQEVCNITLDGPERSSCAWGEGEASRVDYFWKVWSFHSGERANLTLNINTDTEIEIERSKLILPLYLGQLSFIQKQNNLTFTSDSPGTFIISQAKQELCNLRFDSAETLECEFEVEDNPGSVFENNSVSLSDSYLTVSKEKAISLLNAHFTDPNYVPTRTRIGLSTLSDGKKEYQKKPVKVARLSSLPHNPKTAKLDPDSDSELLVLFSPGEHELEPIDDDENIYGLVILRANGTDYVISEMNRRQVRKLFLF